MSIALLLARAQARSVSLHCPDVGQDMVYDMQMLPAQTPAGIVWSVYAQYGKRGSQLTAVTRFAETTLAEATQVINTVWADKVYQKRYREVPDARQSDISRLATPAVESLPAQFKTWQGFSDCLGEASAHLASRAGKDMTDQLFAAVVLADLAYGCGEGLTEALDLVNEPSTTASSLIARLSAETRAWLSVETAHSAANQLLLFKSWL
jgi:hypothetical protein